MRNNYADNRSTPHYLFQKISNTIGAPQMGYTNNIQPVYVVRNMLENVEMQLQDESIESVLPKMGKF